MDNQFLIRLNSTAAFCFKINEKSEQLNQYSEGDVVFQDETSELIIFKQDFLREALQRLRNGIKTVLSGSSAFPEGFDFDKGILYYGNLYILTLDEVPPAELSGLKPPPKDPTEQVIWLFSTSDGYDTFLYSFKNDIFLEISKGYKYLYEEDRPQGSLQEWLRDYQPVYRQVFCRSDLENCLKEIVLTAGKLML